MSFRDFFPRKKVSEEKSNVSEEISCDTAELQQFITDWLEKEGWKFEDFKDFINLAGIKTPAKLSELHEEDKSFKCITEPDRVVSIKLYYSGWPEFWSEIIVIEGEEIRTYIANTKNPKTKPIPKLELHSRKITKSGKELKNYYSRYFCHRMLQVDESHVLKINIEEPNKNEIKSDILVLRNYKKIEEYLLGLDDSLNVNEVYEKMMEFLEFSDREISECPKICIAYFEIVDEKEVKKQEIYLVNGEELKTK